MINIGALGKKNTDFQGRKPTEQERTIMALVLQQDEIVKFMQSLHQIQIAMLRIQGISAEAVVEVSRESLANNQYGQELIIAEGKFNEQNPGGVKVEYHRSLWSRIKNFFASVLSSPQIADAAIDTVPDGTAPTAEPTEKAETPKGTPTLV